MEKKKLLTALISTGLVMAMIAMAAEQSLASTLANIASNLSTLAVAAAIIGVVFGGFYFITAGGDEGRIKTGRSIILWSLVGAVVILLAQAIANIAIEATK